MLLSALILIACVTVTIAATVALPVSLSSSVKQRSIHLRIPSRDSSLPVHSTKERLGQASLIFRHSEESMQLSGDGRDRSLTIHDSGMFYGGRYPRDVGTISGSRTADKGPRSSQKPTSTKSVDLLILNSSSKFQSLADASSIFPLTSINRSQLYSSESEDKMTHLPRTDGYEVARAKGQLKNAKRDDDENGTLSCGDHGRPPCPLKPGSDMLEGKADGSNNDTVLNSHARNIDKIGEEEPKRVLEQSDVRYTTEKLPYADHSPSHSNKTKESLKTHFGKEIKARGKNNEEVNVLWRHIRNGYQNSTPIYSESAQISLEFENSTNFESHSSLTNSTHLINQMTLRKGILNNGHVEETQISMQQDETHEAVTTPNFDKTGSHFDFSKFLGTDGKNEQSEHFLKKNTLTTVQSLSVTTADSHMNDPPFRGPNVGPDLDDFSKEKKELKKGFNFLDPIVKTPKFHSINIGPDWNHAKKVWGIAWHCHCYILSSLFTILAVYSFISLLRAKSFATLLRSGYYLTINSIIFIMCFLRAIYLLYDPYNLSGKYPIIISSILYKVTLPGLTSAFAILVLSLLNSTKTQFLSPKFQKPSVLACLITFFFSLFATCELLVGFLGIPSALLLACQIVFIVWASLSSVCYFLTFKKLHHRALRKQGEMIRLTFTKMHIDGAQLPKKLPKPTLGLAVKIVLVTAVLQLVLCCLLPYGTVFLQGIFSGITSTDPWLWWGYQLLCRILELSICATMSFTATQPQKHFETGDNRFCSILMWFPCSSFADCCRKEEVVDFEVHSDNYANPQGLRNVAFDLPVNSRRLQTNSLPTFRTPLTDMNNTIPMRSLPYSGRHTNHPSALSLLSYYRSKRTLSLSTNEGLEELEKTFCSQAISCTSDGRNNSLRPASMLYKDNGFIRFRRENDPEQPMEMSDEDERIPEEGDTSSEDADSTKANAGSSFQSLLEGDIVQSTLSPFFQIGYNRRFRKMSRISLETTDYSADVSSDQLSNVVNLRNGLSTSALDFNTRKYGSTCSSESAANSFDVTFFLNSNSSPEIQTSPTSTTPVSLRVGSAYRSETEDDKTSSVEGHEVMLRSVSPIVKRASSGKLSLNLNLLSAAEGNHSSGHVNVACGTEDITPDSAVYLDLHLTGETPMNSEASRRMFQDSLCIPPPICSSENSSAKSPDGISSSTTDTASAKLSPSTTTTSQSLSDLRTSNSYVVMPRSKKNSRGLLYKLRGSTFSLNAAIYGYEPMQIEQHPENHRNFCRYEYGKKRLVRSASDRRPKSEAQLDEYLPMTPLGEFWNRGTTTSFGLLGDSGLLGDCQDYGIAVVDVASQTEDSGLHECTHSTCTVLTSNLGIDPDEAITSFNEVRRS